MLKINKVVLPNKLRLVVAPMKSTGAVTVMILVRAGSRYETKNINGIAHFLEHMFFKGGDRYPTPRSVAEAIDSIGGVFNAFTGDEYVGYYVKVAKEKIATAFDVLSDMLLNAQFNAEALDRERGVILEEYNMYEDTPTTNIGDVFRRMLFGDQPLGWSTIGEKSVIKTVARQDFIDYKSKLYTPSNIVVSVSGNTTMLEVKKLIKRYLPLTKSGKKNNPLPYSSPKISKKIKVVYKDTEQAHLALGVPTFGAQNPAKYTAQVLATILGGGMSSRLFMSVRERHGLAYYISARSSHYTDTGYFIVRSGVDVNRIDLAIKTILEEFKDISNDLVSAKELKKAKEYLIGNLILSLEDSDEVAHAFGTKELLDDRIDTIAEIKKKLKTVTAKQVRKLAQEIFKDNRLALTVIGPYKKVNKIKSVFRI